MINANDKIKVLHKAYSQDYDINETVTLLLNSKTNMMELFCKINLSNNKFFVIQNGKVKNSKLLNGTNRLLLANLGLELN
jgi:hypothetical protein